MLSCGWILERDGYQKKRAKIEKNVLITYRKVSKRCKWPLNGFNTKMIVHGARFPMVLKVLPRGLESFM